jgi:hypothetical protein
MLKLLVNMAETTYSANMLKNLNFILTKTLMQRLVEHVFMPEKHDLLNYRLAHSFDPYQSLTWELSKRKLIVASYLRDHPPA